MHGGHNNYGGGHHGGGGGLEVMAIWFFSAIPGAGVVMLALIVLVLNGGF